jgi:hypothetical protein
MRHSEPQDPDPKLFENGGPDPYPTFKMNTNPQP